eukprot:3057169-Rhodomonas_salina.2
MSERPLVPSQLSPPCTPRATSVPRTAHHILAQYRTPQHMLAQYRVPRNKRSTRNLSVAQHAQHTLAKYHTSRRTRVG